MAVLSGKGWRQIGGLTNVAPDIGEGTWGSMEGAEKGPRVKGMESLPGRVREDDGTLRN